MLILLNNQKSKNNKKVIFLKGKDLELKRAMWVWKLPKTCKVERKSANFTKIKLAGNPVGGVDGGERNVSLKTNQLEKVKATKNSALILEITW